MSGRDSLVLTFVQHDAVKFADPCSMITLHLDKGLKLLYDWPYVTLYLALGAPDRLGNFRGLQVPISRTQPFIQYRGKIISSRWDLRSFATA